MFSSLKTLFRLFKGHSLYLSFTFLFAALSISSILNDQRVEISSLNNPVIFFEARSA